MPTFTTRQIAEAIGAVVVGNPDQVITGFAPADSAKPGDLTFAENEAYYVRAKASFASAILVSGDFVAEGKTLLRVANARVAFAKVLPLFFPEPAAAPAKGP